MNVVQVNVGPVRAGLEPDELIAQFTAVSGWSEALLEAGAGSVAVIQRFDRDHALHRNGVDYLFCAEGMSGPFFPGTALTRIRRAIERLRPDVAHVNGLGFPLATRLLRAVLPSAAALVVQDHASGTPPSNPMSRLLRRAALPSVDAFLFTAEEQADSWRAAGLIRREQRVYEVLEASTTLRPLPRAPARETSGVAGAPAVLWVGRLNANKDPLTVLEGFERALAELPGAVLTMVFGEDDLRPEVQERVAASQSLARAVRLVGRVPHDGMPAYYSAADLFVLGSHHEGSGYALLEACACGAIPVVTSIPAFRMLTADGARGALWAPGDAGGCARALVSMARRDLPPLRAAIALHFARELSWPAVGRRAMAIYREVHDRRRGSR
jgi:glycosyltransferase involved in cell wall biosynthesis